MSETNETHPYGTVTFKHNLENVTLGGPNDFLIGVKSDLVPSDDGTVDLGRDEKRWGRIYAKSISSPEIEDLTVQVGLLQNEITILKTEVAALQGSK